MVIKGFIKLHSGEPLALSEGKREAYGRAFFKTTLMMPTPNVLLMFLFPSSTIVFSL